VIIQWVPIKTADYKTKDILALAMKESNTVFPERGE
jgi:hypothetical protein